MPRHWHKSPPTEPRVVPLHQGELDGLCGVYAVINALRLLSPEISRSDADHLFELLISEMHFNHSARTSPLTDGTSISTIQKLLEAASEHLAMHKKVCISHTELFLRRSAPLEVVWDTIRSATTRGRVIIVGLAGRYDHWTVVHRVTGRRLHLADSSMMRFINRSACTTSPDPRRYRLVPKDTIVLARDG